MEKLKKQLMTQNRFLLAIPELHSSLARFEVDFLVTKLQEILLYF